MSNHRQQTDTIPKIQHIQHKNDQVALLDPKSTLGTSIYEPFNQTLIDCRNDSLTFVLGVATGGPVLAIVHHHGGRHGPCGSSTVGSQCHTQGLVSSRPRCTACRFGNGQVQKSIVEQCGWWVNIWRGSLGLCHQRIQGLVDCWIDLWWFVAGLFRFDQGALLEQPWSMAGILD